ncbi:hypothetical protein STRTUCAR8_06300 [Streptomyces turgidiscabies Car8]|uniref:Uncharacterized protein n=1 Tax=Streptomyces turgidiscabies (strain Car8) TaxID=698760 RepID=L7F909_STRT8|nr:hypothetical protein STRTUCAR8_06300 [Streptomyces turgidiscabies Car8]
MRVERLEHVDVDGSCIDGIIAKANIVVAAAPPESATARWPVTAEMADIDPTCPELDQ